MIYARLSYNTQNWSQPSGPNGKSRNRGVHEFDFGFGFEEWLFSDHLFLRDKEGVKYHYGYLEGIHKNYKPNDEQDSLTLFTINCSTSQRFWVGVMNQWQSVDHNESLFIVNQNPGLINAMRRNVVAVTNNYPVAVDKFNQHVTNQNGFQLFNIKWKSIEFNFDIDRPVRRNNPVYKLYRFWLHRR